MALLIAGTGASWAQTSVDCNTGGNLQAAINNIPVMGNPLTITGPCNAGPYSVTVNNAVLVATGGGASIGGQINIFAQFVTLTGLTINGTGVSGSSEGVVVQPGASVTISNCTIENWSGDGVDVELNASAGISGGTIEDNTDSGLKLDTGSTASVGFVPNFAPGSNLAVTITGNTGGGIDATSATLKIETGSVISNNTGGPAIELHQGSADIEGSTVSSPSGETQPAILMLHAGLVLSGPSVTVTGSGTASAILALGNSSVALLNAAVADNDATDPTLLADDGSAIVSAGGNTICAGTLGVSSCSGIANGIAVEAANGSTFHEHIPTPFGAPAAADTITGEGFAEVESNIELGTGNSAPSSWTGAITAAQNSSIRMDGGITVTGAVALSQGSNGFFNTSLTGSNIVTGGVSCAFTTNASAHVAGNTKVLLSMGGASAVTIGTVSPDCLAF